MTDTLTPVLTADWADEQSWKLATYERNGGYRAMRTALGMEAQPAVGMDAVPLPPPTM